MIALVAGGAGFIGSWLCELLVDEGHRVVAVDDLSTGSAGNLDGRVRLVEWDVSRPSQGLEERLRELGPEWSSPDLVCHLASAASPVHYARLPLQTLRAGSRGTEELLELARRHRARFLLASTSEVYGDPAVHPQPESYWGNVNPVGPRSVYDEAKRFAEATTAAYRREGLVDTAIARIFNTYGPRMSTDDGRAVPVFIDQALRGEPLTVAGDGSQTRSLCFVTDTVAGLSLLARSAHPGPVNLGGEEEITMLDLADRIRRLAGSGSPVQLVDRPVDDPGVRRPDVTLAHEQLGWSQEVAMDHGLEVTIAARMAALATGTTTASGNR